MRNRQFLSSWLPPLCPHAVKCVNILVESAVSWVLGRESVPLARGPRATGAVVTVLAHL